MRIQQELERREEEWQTYWCCRDQQRACRMAQASAEKLEHTGRAEKERVASVPQESSWQVCRGRPCQKEKSHLSRSPDREVKRVQVVRTAAPMNSCLNVVVRSPTSFRMGQNGCWPSPGSQLPQALHPSIYLRSKPWRVA